MREHYMAREPQFRRYCPPSQLTSPPDQITMVQNAVRDADPCNVFGCLARAVDKAGGPEVPDTSFVKALCNT